MGYVYLLVALTVVVNLSCANSKFPEVSVISIESTKSVSECHEVPIRRGFFEFGKDPVCQEPVDPVILKEYFTDQLGMCPCKKPHEWVANLARERKIDWESFKTKVLQVPEDFPEYRGYLLVEDVLPKCSTDGELQVSICFRTNSSRTFGRPAVFQSGGDFIYQFDTIHGTVSSSNCTFSNGYGRCWAKHPILYFRSKSSHLFSPRISNSSNNYIAYLIGALVLIIVIILLIRFFYSIRRRSITQKRREVIAQERARMQAVIFDI